MQNRVNDDGGNPSANHVNGVVSLNVDRGKAHKHVEGHHAPEERLASRLPGQEHQDGGDTYMTAGEGCRGAFAFKQLEILMKESVWHGNASMK